MRTLFFVLCLMMLSACNLAAEVEPTPTPPIIVVNPTATRQAATTEPTDQPTATATQRVATSIPPATVINCRPRTDWVTLYSVAAGDTLNLIAQRVNSTAAALQQGNCLPDANRIVVGQVLRVPQAPMPPTLTRTPIQPTLTHTAVVSKPFEIGGLGISAYISADAGFFQLLRDSYVRLSWDGVPTGEIGSVTFAFMGPDWRNKFSNNFTVIGSDSNPLDGISFDWTVPAGLQNRELLAFTYHKTSGQLYHSLPLYVASSAVPGCSITAQNAITAYMQPDSYAIVFGTLKQGETVEVLGRALNGWYAYLPELSYQTLLPVDMKVENLRWLPVDAAVSFVGTCGHGQ